MSAVRLRLAPSPTGYMHVGNARTVLFNWLYARKTGGTMVWRVEDTDRSRYVEAALVDQRDSLAWLGLVPDEGPFQGGAYGPYLQSERLPLYREHAERLLAEGHAYRCFCTPERIGEVREARQKARLKTSYDRFCRGLSDAEAAERLASGRPHVVRLRMPLEGTIAIDDLLRGRIEFDVAELDDIIVMKSDGFPTYHLAVVVDDVAMAITHVLRADEWLPTSPHHVRLYEALGYAQPVWVHVPMVLNPGGRGKLSKRRTVDAHGNPTEQMVQVRQYREAGYLPEAVVNYLALLGWAYSADQDVFTMEEAVERFELEDIKVSPAAWNPEKLDWMNGVYLRALAPDDLAGRLAPFLAEAGIDAAPDQIARLVPLVQERMVTLRDAAPLVDFFFAPDVHPDPADLVPRKHAPEDAARFLDAAAMALADASWTADAIEAALRAQAEALDARVGALLQPIRVAVTGKTVAPPLFETLELLGRERSLARIAEAQALLEGAA